MTKRQLRRGWERARAAFVSDSLVFFVAYLAVMSGIPIFFDPSIFAPNSIQTHLSEWVIRLWGMDLILGGGLSATGLLTERPRIEQGGLAFLFTGAMIFGVAIFLYTGLAGLLPVLTYFFFAASAIARFRKLGKIQDGINNARKIKRESIPQR